MGGAALSFQTVNAEKSHKAIGFLHIKMPILLTKREKWELFCGLSWD